jgi:hypothetical protein
MVTVVPADPMLGDTLVIVGTSTENETEFEETIVCRTWALPDTDPLATAATICVSDHEDTTPGLLPSQRTDVP